MFLAALAFFGGCDTLYRLLQKEGAEERDILGEVTALSPNPRVITLQRLLNLYGYHAGPPDGILGANTRNALEAFQRDNGLPPSRFADKATWALLTRYETLGLVADGEIDVAVVQRVLKKAGCDPGPVDGKLGRKTRAAIRAFQKKEGLAADGRVGYQTLTALARYLAEP